MNANVAQVESNLCLNFTGLTHDHSQISVAKPNVAREHDPTSDTKQNDNNINEEPSCSTIAILRRHPMYDCLILVKKYRHCLQGYSLEFPIDRVHENELMPTNESPQEVTDSKKSSSLENQKDKQQLNEQLLTSECSQRRLVSRFLDGDDPIFRACCQLMHSGSSAGCGNTESNNPSSTGPAESTSKQIAAAVEQSLGTSNNNMIHRISSASDVVNPFVEQIDDKGNQCELVHVPINGLLDRLEGYTRQGVAVDSRVYAFAMGLKTAERIMTTKSMKELQETPI